MLKWLKDFLGGPSEQPQVSPAQDTLPESWRELKTRVFSTRHFDVAIVGESQYQDVLRRAKNSAKDYGGTAHVTAVLAREPDNQYDPGAVKVMNGALETIGYLSRELAAQYRSAVELWEAEGYHIRCQARLSGGEGRRRNIGAWLDLDIPAAIEAKFHDPRTRR